MVQRNRPDFVIVGDLGGTEDAVGKVVVVAVDEDEDEDLAIFSRKTRQRRIELIDEHLPVGDRVEGSRREVASRIGRAAGLLDLAGNVGRGNADVKLGKIERQRPLRGIGQ